MNLYWLKTLFAPTVAPVPGTRYLVSTAHAALADSWPGIWPLPLCWQLFEARVEHKAALTRTWSWSDRGLPAAHYPQARAYDGRRSSRWRRSGVLSSVHSSSRCGGYFFGTKPATLFSKYCSSWKPESTVATTRKVPTQWRSTKSRRMNLTVLDPGTKLRRRVSEAKDWCIFRWRAACFASITASQKEKAPPPLLLAPWPRPAPGVRGRRRRSPPEHGGAPPRRGTPPPYASPCLPGSPHSGSTRAFRPAESGTRTHQSSRVQWWLASDETWGRPWHLSSYSSKFTTAIAACPKWHKLKVHFCLEFRH